MRHFAKSLDLVSQKREYYPYQQPLYPLGNLRRILFFFSWQFRDTLLYILQNHCFLSHSTTISAIFHALFRKSCVGSLASFELKYWFSSFESSNTLQFLYSPLFNFTTDIHLCPFQVGRMVYYSHLKLECEP